MIPAGVADSITITPPSGAGALNDTAPFIERVSPTVGKSTETESEPIGGAGEFVIAKFAPATPGAVGIVATTLYDPETMLAVAVGAVAIPAEFVLTRMVFVPPWNVKLAPEPGAVNKTPTPCKGLEPASVTLASSCVGNWLPTITL
jgi:hypothetical protein